MFQIKRNIARGMKARLGILLQTVLHNALQRRRNVTICLAQLRRFFLQNRAHRVGGSVAMEGALAGEHLVENRSKAENV